MAQRKGERKTVNMTNRSSSSASSKGNGIDTAGRDEVYHNSNPSFFAGNDEITENVLILQGGGSLGAFGCGVFKALSQNNVKIDIVAGTSIGGVNAAIIAGNKNEKHPEQPLEEFWLDLAEGFVDLDNVSPFYHAIEQFIANYYYNYYSQSPEDNKNKLTRRMVEYRNKSVMSFLTSAILGNDNMFKPRWTPEYFLTDPQYFEPSKWTYLYDHSPLAKTIEKFIDYDKLRPKGNLDSRLIMTAVNVLTSEPLVFDSFMQQIAPKHILATCRYPSYNFPWVEVEEGVYAWDGGLLSNTPLREVIDASPIINKRIFLVENYPKKIYQLPQNLAEVYHRTRDVIFCDKTLSTVTMSKVITRYLRYIDELYKMIEDHVDKANVDTKQLEKIRLKYKRYKQESGAEITGVYYISRDEPVYSIYENADFSPQSIKDSIKEGEVKTNQILQKINIHK